MRGSVREQQPPTVELRVEHRAGASVLAVAGEADLYAAPEFKRRLFELIAADGGYVVVDLGEATLIDSTILGALVGALKRLRRAGGELAVVCSSPTVGSVFEITGLHRVFAVYPTLEQALLRSGALDGHSRLRL